MSRSSRGFGRRVATVVDAGSGCGRAIPGRCRWRRGRRRARALAADLKHRLGRLSEGGGAVPGGLGFGPGPGR
jgi:hypothetical protein